jgi:acetyl-CoA C-acetyltransferase
VVRILGGYQTDFARNWLKQGKDLPEVMAEAVNGALESAGLQASDIGSIHVGNFAAELFTSQGHLGALVLEADPGLRGLPSARHEAACASGGVSLLAAWAELDAGRYDVALVVGVEQMKTVSPSQGGEYLGTAAWYTKEAEGIEFPFPKLFGRLGAEYMRRFEIPRDEYTEAQAYLSELMYRHARNNPLAQTRGWDLDAVAEKLDFRISPEITVRDCSQITDGAVALVLATDDYAANNARARGRNADALPALLGWGHTTAPITIEDKLAESADHEYVLPHARKAITDAYTRAGVAGPEALDACEFHDCFTTTAYAAVDLVGLTAPGDNAKAIQEGWLEMAGRLPLNPSGGLIGAGHPVGATGVRQVLDAANQVAGTAGDYQVQGGNGRVLTVNMGGSGTTTVATIVGRSTE